MYTMFLWCALVGGGILAIQILLSLFGVASDVADLDLGGDVDVADGLDLKSMRSITAGVAFFGIAGMAAMSLGLSPAASLLIGGVVGLAAAYLVAVLMRMFRRLDSDGSLSLSRALGETGRVYLPIPANNSGVGKVHVAVQGKTVEVRAVTAHAELPTGASVVVVGVVDSETLEVAPNTIS